MKNHQIAQEDSINKIEKQTKTIEQPELNLPITGLTSEDVDKWNRNAEEIIAQAILIREKTRQSEQNTNKEMIKNK